MMRRAWWMTLGLGLALVCYMLPWYTHDTAGFTTNAFDLAEWASIHPAVRSSSPPMLTSLLLRWPLVAVIIGLALTANRFEDARVCWVVRGVALLLALRLISPSDFFANASDDPNYRQMAQLTAASVIGILVAIMLFRLAQRWQNAVLVGVLLIGVLAGWQGLADAGTLLDNFEIAVSIGPGIIGYTLCMGLVLMVAIWSKLSMRQPASF
ncbi:MAG: hypothetical protein JXA10_05080 [Anaerolineae bacterium]|nr:hypothetical protein [Anaerolineae bacterium]